MSLSVSTIDAMLAAGCSAEQIAAVVKADIAEQEEKRAAKREGNAERQKRFRQRRKSRKITQSNDSNALHDVTPPNDNTLTPGDISPDGENHQERDVFPRPDFAEPDVWRDFLKNRKRKRQPNTATAYKAFLDDIRRISDDEWPPGRLLEHATAKGWAGIYDPREAQNGSGKSNQSRSSTRQTGERLAARLASRNRSTSDNVPRLGSSGGHD